MNDRNARFGFDQHRKKIAGQVRNTDAECFLNLLTSPELLETIETHLPEHRERLYPPMQTLSMFMAQAMSADRSCQSVVDDRAVKRALGGFSTCSIKTGGYCKARQRLPLQMVSTLAKHSGRMVKEQTLRSWKWRGRTVKLVDGTTVTLPDTEQNRARFAQQLDQPPPLGLPIARIVAVMSLSSAVVLDASIGPYHGPGSGELSMLRGLQDIFEAEDILLGDALYCSYFFIADLLAAAVDAVFERHGSRSSDFRTGQRLGTRDHWVVWKKSDRPQWMSPERYQAYPQEITLREVKVRGKIVVTTMLAPRKVSKAALGDLYRQRWSVELNLRDLKSTLGMETLSCKSPQMGEKEMWVYFLAYNLIRLLMAASAAQYRLQPRELSFKHTLQLWTAWSQRQYLMGAVEELTDLFALIAQLTVADRAGRVEPRAVRRRRRPYPGLTIDRHLARESIRKHGHPKLK